MASPRTANALLTAKCSHFATKSIEVAWCAVCLKSLVAGLLIELAQAEEKAAARARAARELFDSSLLEIDHTREGIASDDCEGPGEDCECPSGPLVEAVLGGGPRGRPADASRDHECFIAWVDQAIAAFKAAE